MTPKGLPERIQINAIEVSPHDAASAWIAATMYKHDDARPYLYRTTDYGKTWTKLVGGIPDGAFTRVVREDPVRTGLLFAGTERGLYVSFDDGVWWQPFQRNLPVVPITDLTIKDGDLVVATQGRAFWILDDLSPLRQWFPSVEKEAVHVFKPRPAVRFGSSGRGEGGPPRGVGQNPPAGAIVDVWLKDAPPKKPASKDALTLEILDGETVLRTFTSEKKEGEDAPADEDAEKPLELKRGLNRLSWDLRMLKPSLVPKAIIWGPRDGPLVAPGTYTARVKLGDAVLAEKIEVVANPMVKAPAADLKSQSAFLADVRDRLSETHQAALTCRDVKKQVKDVVDRAGRLGKKEPLAGKGKALSEQAHRHRGEAREPEGQERAGRPEFPAAARPSVRGRRERRGERRGRPAGLVRRLSRGAQGPPRRPQEAAPDRPRHGPRGLQQDGPGAGHPGGLTGAGQRKKVTSKRRLGFGFS